ncbi:MAG: prolyl oligopeptidase family serine peptidase [Acidobacteria bacterium]|nr:prolyl oligopeptidase family serine peptidase [Acidobacteriota bacterium]
MAECRPTRERAQLTRYACRGKALSAWLGGGARLSSHRSRERRSARRAALDHDELVLGAASPRNRGRALGRGWSALLLFPPAGGDAREVERCQLIAALEEPLRERRIKVYTPDGIPARGWTDPSMPPHERATLQLRYADYVYNELVPFIRGDCFDPGLEIVAAGAAFGAFNALMALCRHPDAFRAAICLSGIYDLEHFMGGAHTLDFHFASPLHFLPYLDEGEHLETLRGRIAVLAMGGGRFEEPQDSWRMADVLGSRGVPNRVDDWARASITTGPPGA